MAALSIAGAEFIARFEGLSLKLYEDPSGNASIGIGHLVHLGPINGSEPADFKAGITTQQAYDLLKSDAQKAADCVSTHVRVPLSQSQADALISFVFNVGVDAFQTSDLLVLLNQGDYASVPAQLMRWVHGGGQVLPGLVTRREAEGALFAQGGSMVVALSKTGEIADFLDADQFPWQNGKPLSQFMCGFFAVALIKAMAAVGQPPKQTVAQVIAEAEQWYTQYNGSDSVTNTAGMTLIQLYELLHQIGVHYQATALNIATVKSWIKNAGYPVILAITEISVHDLDPKLHGANPYPWRAAGTHIIVATGVAADGNILVRDTANCTNLYDPNSLRLGPRKYDAAQLQIVSATVAVPDWLPRPASAIPPTAPPVPVPTPAPSQPLTAPAFTADDEHVWSLIKPGIPTNTGIAQDWLRARHHGMEIGPALETERTVIKESVSYAVQRYIGAEAWWSHATHTCSWRDARGQFTVPA